MAAPQPSTSQHPKTVDRLANDMLLQNIVCSSLRAKFDVCEDQVPESMDLLHLLGV
jgi:hypothetical protein